jgi:6-methylsalicylate decarboxylase
MDLVVAGTLQHFTNIRYQLPQVGGALPSIFDRFFSIALRMPQTTNVYEILAERVWWDSAGPTYSHQVLGLLAYGVG